MPAIVEMPPGPITPACCPRPSVMSPAIGELNTRTLPAASTTAVLLPRGVMIAHPARVRGPSLLTIGGGGGGAPRTLSTSSGCAASSTLHRSPAGMGSGSRSGNSARVRRKASRQPQQERDGGPRGWRSPPSVLGVPPIGDAYLFAVIFFVPSYELLHSFFNRGARAESNVIA